MYFSENQSRKLRKRFIKLNILIGLYKFFSFSLIVQLNHNQVIRYIYPAVLHSFHTLHFV